MRIVSGRKRRIPSTGSSSFRAIWKFGWLWTILLSLTWLWASVAPAEKLPEPQMHPLPPSLERWQAPGQHGDYFDQIKSTQVGYLVWSDFPIKVYIQAPEEDQTSQSPSLQQQARAWFQAVLQAVQDWQPYLPLQVVSQAATADITFWRTTPPNASQVRTRERARSAETRYEVYVSPATTAQPARLRHRASIALRPSQAPQYLEAAARHELGHALGIGGHSPLPTDVMYYAQVRHPPAISVRDVNTLKRIYQQPTRLGWPLPQP